ncbi:MAG: phenylalanine--tRNA ligase subunit alpha [Nitrospirae bacterium]|nr:phenylalanine--tRNA ligase subunit alpha [Nitrospirota bacterium]
MEERIAELRRLAEREISAAPSLDALERLRIKLFGRKGGAFTELTKSVATLPVEARPLNGRLLNEAKNSVTNLLETRHRELSRALATGPTAPQIDTTFPGRRPHIGRRHPLTLTMDLLCDVFLRMGFQVRQGPEIETDYHNFEALNMPPDHPARDMQDTFYIADDKVLRTHTSPVQIRTMLAERPPIQMIAPGRVFRRDSDLSHSPVFHQVEGLMADRGIHMGHLKGILQRFVEDVFGTGLALRFRPSFFPFVEPGAEGDMQCVACRGAGCGVCGGSGWVEILGAGMVHPRVFENVGYDPKKITGFAFGIGVERIAMLLHNVGNIRLFYENDMRFLEQF